jgi:hypothetical protein
MRVDHSLDPHMVDIKYIMDYLGLPCVICNRYPVGHTDHHMQFYCAMSHAHECDWFTVYLGNWWEASNCARADLVEKITRHGAYW